MRLSFLAAALIALAPAAQADEITIFAAASLKDALDEIAADWQASHGDTVVISYAGSSQLAKQIQEGAPADLFISASTAWMDAVQDSGDIDPATRRDLLGNTLVLVGTGKPAEAAVTELPGLLGDGKLAMAMVDSVPAGQYGKAALTALGLWEQVEGQVAQADNVRAALKLVATGEAPLGIVYGSDAVAEPGVGVVATFPADSHEQITYPAAVTRAADTPQAAAFLDSLSQEPARSVFESQGFTVTQ
ncbi:molybdate ABC transporter substrate-binding protein [Paracoccus sp. P2]|uniref:Molybdate ABC transporter substrate-binding protein n=1 Tax=Paracoccus pantotrophus TaxID=82367 RepID=A0A454NMX6_PARPN|nr:molybdate ABC transporter substrate-binding protein [Paracoccus pantotrophus]QFG36687.1 molybdate ABC transporter substrate-binding protein [Paracoccus pantotrophus]QLH16349.1 molybdate ABC transporter substrate-binding protein [Paracoccus pantotrophus]RKS52915.1 molybdate transport system substrate-binding protein [Paracoccus pantotrophus]RNI18464.1 molybdate ABC transporter substrate-binding protein [Paracoccus pantotrophus]